jgi:hypothetical protein
VEQEQVETLVRLTVRLSGLSFAAALMLFAASDRQRALMRYAIAVFAVFVLAHTIHFGAVIWLARLTTDENIRDRGGWPLSLGVGVLFYASAFAILRAWRQRDLIGSVSESALWSAHPGVLFITAVFLNSYIARVGRLPIYWLPTIGLISAVTFYFLRARSVARAARC